MEAVTSDGMLLVELLRHGVAIGLRRHCRVEGGVENSDLRHFEDLLGRRDAQEIRWVVQRGQGHALLDLCHGICVDDNGVAILRATVYNSVTYDLDVSYALHWATGRRENGDHLIHCLPMVFDRTLYLLGLLSHCVLNDGAVEVDLVHEPDAQFFQRL